MGDYLGGSFFRGMLFSTSVGDSAGTLLLEGVDVVPIKAASKMSSV